MSFSYLHDVSTETLKLCLSEHFYALSRFITVWIRLSWLLVHSIKLSYCVCLLIYWSSHSHNGAFVLLRMVVYRADRRGVEVEAWRHRWRSQSLWQHDAPAAAAGGRAAAIPGHHVHSGRLVLPISLPQTTPGSCTITQCQKNFADCVVCNGKVWIFNL